MIPGVCQEVSKGPRGISDVFWWSQGFSLKVRFAGSFMGFQRVLEGLRGASKVSKALQKVSQGFRGVPLGFMDVLGVSADFTSVCRSFHGV